MQQQYQQISCEEAHDNGWLEGVAVLTVWVPVGSVKLNDVVTFKETGDREWRVREVFGVSVSGVNRGWGLDLPKSQRTER